MCECLRPDGASQTPSPLAERELARLSLATFPSCGIQHAEREHPCSALLSVPSEETPRCPMVSLRGERKPVDGDFLNPASGASMPTLPPKSVPRLCALVGSLRVWVKGLG